MTLYELNHIVRTVLEKGMEEAYWVQGEFADARVGYGGHFYGELVQKDEAGQGIIARARVNCWASTYNILRLRFQRETGEALRQGLQVKLQVRVTFHEQYGYSLNIIDIDSTFTLGDMARRRREILLQLEADGILHDNQRLPLPRLLRRVAVISSAGAAGYGDFCHQLEMNDYGLAFDLRLFPAVMQGQHVEESIIAALEQVGEEAACWDVVVIIRGGGATGDLSDFDSYPLACCIAQFPIPVITGIGHERDETVLDHVAHTHVKTPTAAAAFLIAHQAEELAIVDTLLTSIHHSALQQVERARGRLSRAVALLPISCARLRERTAHRMELLTQRVASAIAARLEREHGMLRLLVQRVDSLDPTRLLRLGYSVTLSEGRIVRDAATLRKGDRIETRLEKGTVKSIVE